ncbi:hypothetical protein HELRODRAFT_177355 [Helobdella robusta]|uniref:C-type lectin domain-containing protein n=1 Tax=Helobdella robusta TaxID=6412 RepID=T1FBK1_HELRO|nr:hypothetical protein HELRODRAFT_177355 [Helobdella robusta]ESN98117.1 hypothetical protein HELRODRAFT_177355 [Helobdella robusta]
MANNLGAIITDRRLRLLDIPVKLYRQFEKSLNSIPFKSTLFADIKESLKEKQLIQDYGLEVSEKDNLNVVVRNIYDGIKSQKININSIIALIKKLKTFDWGRLVNDSSLSDTLKTLNIKKLGAIIAAVKDNIFVDTPELLFDYELNPNDFEKYKKVALSIAEGLSKMNMSYSSVVSTLARGFEKKFMKSIESGKLNINMNGLGKKIRKKLNFTRLNADPFDIKNDELKDLGMDNETWNQISYRIIEEGEDARGNVEQDRVVYRDSIGSDCIVVYYGVTSWYEAQSFCAEKGGYLMVFKDDQDFALLDKPELKNVPDLSSVGLVLQEIIGPG